MSEDDFERADYGDLSEGQSGAAYQTSANALRVNPQCSHDSCTNSTEDPAEPAWVKLMSAVPQATQISSLRAAREGTMMLPPGQTIQGMVASIRPQPEADYALDTIRDEWADFREQFMAIGPKLEQGLSTLSGFWKGDDFDGFEEQAETVLKNCKTVVSDIGGENGDAGVIKVLDDKQLEIYEQQGGTACVYPAPKFYMQGTKCGSHQIHIRPPFFKNCEIHKNDEIKKAVELAGFDPTVIDEVQEGRETWYNQWMEYVTANPEYEEDGLKGEPLAKKKADEYADERLVSLGAEGSDQLEEESARVNEEVTERHANVEAHVQEIEPDVRKSEPTTFNDGETPKFDSGGLDVGDGGGMPDLDGNGIDDMQSPADLKSLNGTDTSGLNGTDTSGLNGSGATPTYANSGSDLNGLNDENPFNSAYDPDNVNNSGQAPGSYNGGNGLNSNGLNGTGNGAVPGSPDYSGGNGLNGTGNGTVPGSPDYSGGNGLNGLDDNPWNAGSDPDDISGGLAGGGGGSVPSMPSSTGAPPGGLNPGGGLNPTSGLVGGSGPGRSGLTNSPRSGGSTGRGLGSTGTGGPRKLDSGRSSGLSGKSGGLGSPPGSAGKGSGLGSGGSGAGRGLGSGAGGSGAGRGLGGGAGAAGAGAGSGAGGRGAGGAHSSSMMPGGAAGGKGKEDDKELERQFWIAEDDDVWGGGPEDEEEDPYA